MKKIPTLFKREYANHRVVEIKDEITPGCEDAFQHGVATVKIDGEDIGGYLPIEFVRENLVETFITTSHEYRRVNGNEELPVVIYDGTDMANELATFSSQITLKTKKVNDQIYAVYFEQDGITKVGYIYATDFVIEGENVIRNAFIIVIVALSVTVTSIYFILRKRNDF